MKLGEFLTTQASKLGLQNDPLFVAFVQANPQLAQLEFDDKIANPINSGLMSIDGAKNNTDVKKHYDALALNNIDAKLNPLAELYGATAEFDAEKSTYKRIDILSAKIAAKIKEVQDKAASGDVTKDTEVKRLNGELQKLQTQLQNLQTAKDTEIAKLRADHATEIQNSLIDFELSGKQYANTQIDAKTNVTIARAILQSALGASGAIVVNDGGVLKLKNANAPELDLLDSNNKPWTFSGFAEKALADAHLLAVSKPTTQPQNQQQPIVNPTIKVTPTGGQQQIDTTAFAAAAQKSLSDLGIGTNPTA